jgi:hypothetical protein
MGKGCFILRYDTLILFCVFSVFSTASHTKANSSVADDLQTNVGHSFPKETNRTRRSLTGASLMGALGIGISLIDFTVSNIRQTFSVSAKELTSHLDRIQKELKNQNSELQSINKNIKNLDLSLGYSQKEKRIKGSLWALRDYLEDPNDHYRNIFIKQGEHLTQDINFLVDGLLGQNALSPDVMAVIRDAAEASL